MTLLHGARRALLSPGQLAIPLTLSGNEITPYVRRFGLEGDGLNPNDPLGKYSIGVWEATTNLVTNGAAGTNTTGTNSFGVGGSIARVTAASEGIPKLFGDYVFKITCPANAFLYAMATSLTLTAALYTQSMYVYVPASWDGGNLEIRDQSNSFTSATIGSETNSGGVTGAWTRITQQITPDAGDLIGDLVLGTTLAPTAGKVIYVCGIQVENQPLATPYVHTDGGTASRTAARVRIPNISRYLNETQGWVCVAYRAEYAYDADPITDPGYFGWGADSNNCIRCYYSNAGNAFGLRRVSASTGTSATTGGGSTHVRGDIVVPVWNWDAAALRISANGGAFGSTADANIPNSSAAANADLGTDGVIPGRESDSTILFVALGRGTLTDANAAALNHIARNNRIDSRPEDLPGGCTFKWPSENWREGMAL